MMRTNDFACLILTHGRADNVRTYKALRDHGYTGKIYLVVDDEDDQIGRYKDLYGDQVYVFNKQEYFEKSDLADTDETRSIVLPARNACFDIANELKLQYFLELDDDYNSFMFRYEEDGKLRKAAFPSLDKIFDIYLEFLETSGAITVAFAQGGDFIGGTGSSMWQNRIMRKAMNAFFCKTLRPFQFYGRLNEDVTMYVLLGQQGKLIFTIADIMLNQGETQQNKGGLTDAYLKLGTYRKSFYSILYAPSAVKIGVVGNNDYRIHHQVSWNYVTPKIIHQKWKKKFGGWSEEELLNMV